MQKGVFDEARWKKAVGDANWATTAYVLNRGGRFEDASKAYAGELLGHPFGKLLNLYVEPVATARDAVTGDFYSGVGKYEPVKNANGKPVADKGGAK